ncbi:hypothetical protein P8452_12856 [Trifolium repens]|jgi:hypothetical protein|nr:hypothetical protein P8452_12856 [Trifolium repens]
MNMVIPLVKACRSLSSFVSVRRDAKMVKCLVVSNGRVRLRERERNGNENMVRMRRRMVVDIVVRRKDCEEEEE